MQKKHGMHAANIYNERQISPTAIDVDCRLHNSAIFVIKHLLFCKQSGIMSQCFGALAQLGERQVRNLEVRGSIPLCSTISHRRWVYPVSCGFFECSLNGRGDSPRIR